MLILQALQDILNLFDNAKKEVVISTTDEGLLRKLENMKTTFRKLNQKRVQIKILAPLKTGKAREAAKELSEYAKVKSSKINSRFVVIDGQDAVIMINDDKDIHENYDNGLWVNSPFFAGTLVNLFYNEFGK